MFGILFGGLVIMVAKVEILNLGAQNNEACQLLVSSCKHCLS